MPEVLIENLFLIPTFFSECGVAILFYNHFHEILTWISLHVWSGFFGSTCVMPGFDIWNYKNCLGWPSFSLDLACSQLNQAIIKQVFINGCGIDIHGSALKSWLWTSFDNVYLTVKALMRNFNLLSLNYFGLIDLPVEELITMVCLKSSHPVTPWQVKIRLDHLNWESGIIID